MPSTAEVGGGALFLHLGKIIFADTVRDGSISAVDASALYSLEGCCSCAKAGVSLLFEQFNPWSLNAS